MRWVRHLGFLGILGLLGFLTQNPGFYGFFGFLGFANFGEIKSTERFPRHVAQSGRNAFAVAVLTFPVAVFATTLTPEPETIYPLAFGIIFGLQILIFSFSLFYYQNK